MHLLGLLHNCSASVRGEFRAKAVFLARISTLDIEWLKQVKKMTLVFGHSIIKAGKLGESPEPVDLRWEAPSSRNRSLESLLHHLMAHEAHIEISPGFEQCSRGFKIVFGNLKPVADFLFQLSHPSIALTKPRHTPPLYHQTLLARNRQLLAGEFRNDD